MHPGQVLDDLMQLEKRGRLPRLLLFWGHQARADHPGPWTLSQWWPSRFDVDGEAYRHAEGRMMAEKARLFGDVEARERILAARHPSQAKAIGREVRGFDQAVWERECFGIVVEANVAKFGQSPELRSYLLSTAPRVLVEASPVDRIWGIGLSAKDPAAERPSMWRGRNLLGFALMEAREQLLSS